MSDESRKQGTEGFIPRESKEGEGKIDVTYADINKLRGINQLIDIYLDKLKEKWVADIPERETNIRCGTIEIYEGGLVFHPRIEVK
jgi:hypothetical protein